MGHAQIDNKTPFVFEPLFLVDEEFRPLLVTVVKATFEIDRGGRCVRAEKQLPLDIGGKLWGENPETSSYKFEPEVAFVKSATDVVLIGHAYTPRSGVNETGVRLTVGPLVKEARVLGDRSWYKSGSSIGMTRALAFEKMPLIYERAFGGWDRSDRDPRRHLCDLRNPVGTGFRAGNTFEEGLRLPNIEDPRMPIKQLTDKPSPVGFGFVSPHWQPRAALAGTFGEAWQKGRAPLLPKDFDRRHMNAASQGLVAPGYLRGDERVTALGVTPDGSLQFTLPGLPTPVARVALFGDNDRTLPLDLDTVIIETDERRVQMIWRANVTLRTGPHDVRAVVAESPEPASQPASIGR
jgi:hypothetical protein